MRKNLILLLVVAILLLVSCKNPLGPDPGPVLPKYGKLVVDYYSDGTYAEDAYVLFTASWTNYGSVQMTKVEDKHWQYVKENLEVNSKFRGNMDYAHYAGISHAGYSIRSGFYFNNVDPSRNIYETGNGPFFYFWFDGTNVLL